MMFRFPSVICTRCTGFFCLAIIKGPPNDIYCIIEEPSKHYFTEKVSYSRIHRNHHFDTIQRLHPLMHPLKSKEMHPPYLGIGLGYSSFYGGLQSGLFVHEKRDITTLEKQYLFLHNYNSLVKSRTGICRCLFPSINKIISKKTFF